MVMKGLDVILGQHECVLALVDLSPWAGASRVRGVSDGRWGKHEKF